MATIDHKRSRGTKALLASLEALEACIHDGITPGERYGARIGFAVPKPATYSASAVRRLRRKLAVSQAGFAQLLGVSRILVQSWERGIRKPSPLACRLMDTISADPAGWVAGLRRAG